MKKLEITFGKDGSVKTEVFGVKGPACKDMTAFLDNFFGNPTETTLKESYNEVEIEDINTITNGLPSGYCG